MDTLEVSMVAGSVQLIPLGWKFDCARDAGRWIVTAQKGEIHFQISGASLGEAYLRAEGNAMAQEFDRIAA